jgi:FtsH-binding integral membrane protein
MFVSFSLSVLYSPRRNVFYVAGLLSSSLTMLFWLQLINLFIGSQTGYTIELYLGLVAFSLFVIYDTQIMIAKAEQGSKKVLQHSLDLFIDFVSVFVRVLRVLLRKEEEKERKRRKRQSD